MSQIILDEGAAPSTPSSGKLTIFTGTDGIVYAKDDTGAVSRVSNTITLKTAVTASGTSVDFTGIPSDVKEINVILAGISTNGTSMLLVQLGDVDGFEITGYISSSSDSTSGVTSSTAGFLIRTASAGSIISGVLTLALVDSATNTWAASLVYKASVSVWGISAGDKSLSAVLTQIRLTTVNGTDTFDAGKVNVSYKA